MYEIETHHIEIKDGESPEDAIARHLGDKVESCGRCRDERGIA